MRMPPGIGPFHIVGIGGIGMSAIAEVLHHRGYQVQGSDLKSGANVQRLKDKGIHCVEGHDPANLGSAKFVVVSTAIKTDNPEVEAARAADIPIITRAEMLAELMRECATVAVTGTHGKTTTTSLISELLLGAGLDPTVMSGGIINSFGSNARIGQGEWMVVEADESDGTFLKLPARIGVVTNIDAEHMDYWRSLERMHGAFRSFFKAVPFYGLLVAGVDHPIVREMIAGLRREQMSRRVLTYGAADDADVRLGNLRAEGRGTLFDADLGPKAPGGERIISDLSLPVPGHYNALNALAALTVGLEIGISDGRIRDILAGFGGVQRRFTETGQWQGVRFFDDYAHHPVEIAAVLKAAREAAQGAVIAVVQPHRYTRLQNLFGDFCTCFADADTVIVTPVYSAGEALIEGFDRDSLIEGLKRQGQANVLATDGLDTLADQIAELAKPGDLVIGLGAGTITEWAHALPDRLTRQAPAGEVA